MRNKMLFWGILTATAVSLFSCAKVEPVIETAEPENNGVPFEIRILGDETKTTNSGMSTLWAASDAVNLFHASSTSGPYTSDGEFTTTTAGANVTFTGTLAEALSSGSYYWYAIYPYSKNITTPANTGTKGYVTIGSSASGAQSQTGVSNMNHIQGTSYPLAGVSAAVDKNDVPSFSLSHLSTLMEVSVTNGSGHDITVTSISLYSESEDIVGTYFVNFTGADPVFTASGPTYVSKTATLSVASGAIADGETETFYLAVKPFTAVAGDDLTLSVTTAEYGEQEKTVQPAVNKVFKAGKKNTLGFTYTKNVAASLPEVNISSTPYTVGFEDAEGFTASSSYNNTIEKQDGAADRKWNILSGSVSTTQALVGSNSMLLRDYKANAFAPYVSTAFKFNSLKYITFKSKTKKLGYNLQIYYSTDDGVSWTAGDSFSLTTTPKVYSTTFASTLSGAAIKFAIAQPESRTDNQDVWIDDVEFHSTVPDANVAVTTKPATSYENTAEGTTATLNGSFTLNYGAVTGDVTECGFKYKIGSGDYNTVTTTKGPTSINTVSFTKDVTGLTKNTLVTYYAYVIYNGNTVNGETTTFTPTQASVTPESVVFTFNTDAGIAELGISKPAKNAGTNLGTDPYVKGSISLAATSVGTATRVYNSSSEVLDLRIYNGGTFTFTSSAGNITSIVLAGNTVGGFTCGDKGTFTSGTWSGSASSVVLTATGTEKIDTITVFYLPE